MTDLKTIKVDLDEPVTVNDKSYSSLTFRKMKAKDMVAGDLVQGEQRKTMAIFASMASVPIGVIEELDFDDYEKVAAKVVPLMGKSARAALAAAKEKLADSSSTPSSS